MHGWGARLFTFARRNISGPDRTLREEELQTFQARVVEAVGQAGARLRS